MDLLKLRLHVRELKYWILKFSFYVLGYLNKVLNKIVFDSTKIN